MGKFVQNESMDTLISILVYFGPETDLIIIDSRFICNNNKIQLQNTVKFEGKIKELSVFKIERGDIKFSKEFDILNIYPDTNKITVYIYEY